MLFDFLKHMRGISFSLDGTIQNNQVVNSIATIASIVQNHALIKQIDACAKQMHVNIDDYLTVYMLPS